MKLRALLLSLGVTTLGALALSGTAHAYSNSRLMDDQIFDNVNSLSQSQVADFLAARTGPFTKLGTASPCLSGYSNYNFRWDGTDWYYGDNTRVGNSTGWVSQAYTWNTAWGSATIPASDIIYKAAQMWGLNPEVIIATLQKEESLITGTSCDGWRYNSAMGYGCPDSGGCNPKYVGFMRQVLWGSWQLKFNKERAIGNTAWDDDGSITYGGYMTQGNRKRCTSCASNYYDGYATIDGQSIFLENGTTASLYTYTPHLGQAFPGIFQGWFGLAVLPSFSVSFIGQSAYPSLLAGNQTTVYFSYKNAGSGTWYDDTSIGSAPTGNFPMHLATSHPTNRRSPFGATWGGDQNRPTGQFSAVYEADGTTLAASQHIVQPGQIAKISFTLSVPSNQAAGTYREFFMPIREGTADGGMNDPWTFLDVTVTPSVYSAQYFSESGYLALFQGTSTTGFFSYKNTGNQPWYDDASIGSAPVGNFPMHLATSHPTNRSSAIGASWGGDRNRATGQFAAVYEADGTTLATNQHVVQPGQIGKMSFTITAGPGLTPGTYREYFMLVREGTPTGGMNDPGTYMDIVVNKATYQATFITQSAYPSIAKGQQATVFFSYKNSGNQPWYDNTSVGSAPAGSFPMHLATSHSIGRSSVLGATWGGDQNRPTVQFSAVYEADGSTLAASQHIVQPGQIGKMSFVLSVPSNLATGVYREFFMPIREGTADGGMNDPWTFLDVTVTP